MKRQLQGIALILLGILLALFELAGRVYIPIVGSILLDWGFFSLILGIAGVIVVFFPNRKE